MQDDVAFTHHFPALNDACEVMAVRRRIMRPVVSPTDPVACRTRGLLAALWISGNALITDISSLCRRLAAEVFPVPLLAPDTHSFAPKSWRIGANNAQTTGPILQFICSSPKDHIESAFSLLSHLDHFGIMGQKISYLLYT
jgi:hypothetical protein